eukprot:TRINITY_DN19293_c0_g1_i4.p1 TRINITY_DN19293_c0_g1~~TRINITY_DN19293_c0_g1_i4.p1  ORF type:complete len:353 (-),score=135.43 TRINITY_DN19293_c0_g1_i4:67-1125(-)
MCIRDRLRRELAVAKEELKLVHAKLASTLQEEAEIAARFDAAEGEKERLKEASDQLKTKLEKSKEKTIMEHAQYESTKHSEEETAARLATVEEENAKLKKELAPLRSQLELAREEMKLVHARLESQIQGEAATVSRLGAVEEENEKLKTKLQNVFLVDPPRDAEQRQGLLRKLRNDFQDEYRDRLMEAYGAVDKDNNDSISVGEMRAGFGKVTDMFGLRGLMSIKEVTAVFNWLDSDQSGALSFQEFSGFVTGVVMLMSSCPTGQDEDEHQSTASAAMDARNVFNRADTDLGRGDGKVSRAELKRQLLKDPALLKTLESSWKTAIEELVESAQGHVLVDDWIKFFVKHSTGN